jgi:Putative DNA-binding domain
VTRAAAKTKKPVASSPTSKVVAPAALTLKETQALFQDAILGKDDRILRLLMDNSRTGRDTLFGVYQNGYVGRLVEILGNDYEDLRTYLGKDAFDDVARAYVAACPSHSQNARWFGSRMPTFLTEQKRYARRPQLSELAKIEQVLSNAFDATDAPHISLQDLAAHSPELWGRLTFVPHPSAMRLDVKTNAFAMWRAIKHKTPVPRLKITQRRSLLIWRQGTMPMIREMPDEEAMMWTEAGRGASFGALCEMLATFDNPDEAAMRAANYLQGWLTSEMLTSAALAPKAPAAGLKRPARMAQ